MTRRALTMPLAFKASQHLDLSVRRKAQHLPAYLREDDRLIAALLDGRQLTRLGPGRYRYLVTKLQVFQLQVTPVVILEIEHHDNSVVMRAVDCELEGLGVVDDFKLTLEAILNATPTGLMGDASLAVQVSQPPLLRLIPRRLIESTGESILSGILIGIKARVGQQLLSDFRKWCRSIESSEKIAQKTAAVQGSRA